MTSDVHPVERREDLPAGEESLSALFPSGPASSLSPAVDPLSRDQIRFRSELLDAVQVLALPGVAPGTTRTHEAAHESRVPDIKDKLSSPALPSVTENKFVAFFGALTLLGPRFLSPVPGQAAVR